MPKYTSWTNLPNPVSSGAQLRGFKTFFAWAIHQGAILGASIPYHEVGKVMKMGKSAPENSRNQPKQVEIGPEVEKGAPENKDFHAAYLNSRSRWIVPSAGRCIKVMLLISVPRSHKIIAGAHRN
jgi:hypothetical protein